MVADIGEAPTIVSLNFAPGPGEATVTFGLSGATPGGVTVALFKGHPTGTTWLASTSTVESTGRFTLNPSLLEPGFEYTVAVTLNPSISPVWGTPAVLVFQAPTVTGATLTGGVVEVTWTLPASTSIAAVVATVYDLTAEAVLATASCQGSGARLPLPGPLEPTGKYTVYLAGSNGVSRGPLVSLPSNLQVGSPTPVSAVYAANAGGGGFTVTVKPASVPSTPVVAVALLLRDGQPATEANVSGESAAIALPQALDPAARWSVAMLYRNGIVSGPAGVAVEVPLAAPQITSASWDEHEFALSWTLPGCSGAAVSIRRVSDGVEVGSTSVPAGCEASFTPTLSIDPTLGYEAYLAPILGSARGLFSSAAAMIVAPPTVSAVQCVEGSAIVTLGGVGRPANSAVLELHRGGSIVSTAVAGPSGGMIALPGGPSTALTLTARALGSLQGASGTLRGPACAALALLTGAPILSSAAGSQTNCVLSWKWPGGVPTSPAPTAYELLLLAGDTETVIATKTAPAEQATAPFDSPPPAGTLIAVRAVAGKVSGPRGGAVPVLTTAPTLRRVSADVLGALVELSAVAPPAERCLISIQAAGQTVGSAWSEGERAVVSLGTATTGTSYTATAVASAAEGIASGPAASLAAVLVPPTLSSPSADGKTLTVAVTAPVAGGPTTTAYRVELLRNGVPVLSEGSLAPTQGALIIPAARTSDPTAHFALRVMPLAGSAIGPAASIEVLLAAPSVQFVSVEEEGAGRVVKASVDSSGFAQSAALEAVAIADGVYGTPVTVSAGKVTLPLTGSPKNVAVAVRAKTAASGPWSEPVSVVLLAPAGVTVSYDGRRARVSWEAVPAPGVRAYAVKVLAGETTVATATVTSTSATLSVPFEPQASATSVVVQALTAAGSGAASEPIPLFTPGLYLSTATGKAPYLLPATTAAMSAGDIVLQLPQLFTTPPLPAELPVAAPFAMAVGQAPFAYTLTMAHDSAVWTFSGEAIRVTIQTAYSSLLAALKALNITPLGWRTVQDAIARAMPQTFAETLRYACGFVPEEGYVDLVPGMVLRAEYQSYQYLGPEAVNSDLLDGFLTTATAEYQVSSYVGASGSWLTGFDAFLGRVAGAEGTGIQAPTVSPAGASGAGGVADLYYTQFRRPFCRLVYPPELAAPDKPGTPKPAFNVALLAADDYPTLEAATTALRNNHALSSGVAVTYLRGRSTLSACLRVWIDGSPLVVPLGTTVGNLLEGMGRRPPMLSGLPLDGLQLQRGAGAAILDAGVGSTGYAVGSGQTVHLDWLTDVAYDASTDVLALPLLPGDRLRTGA